MSQKQLADLFIINKPNFNIPKRNKLIFATKSLKIFGP